MTSTPPHKTEHSKHPEAGQDPLGRLDNDLEAFEAKRRKTPPVTGLGGAAGDGYRVLGQMLGGVLGGVGLGWFADRLAHTSPLGLVIGLVIGSGLSIWSTIQTASRIGAAPKIERGTVDPAPIDDDDDDHA